MSGSERVFFILGLSEVVVVLTLRSSSLSSSASPICHITSDWPGSLACNTSKSRSSTSSSEFLALDREGTPSVVEEPAAAGSGFLLVSRTTPPMRTKIETVIANSVQPLYASISSLKTRELRNPDAV